MTSRKIELYQLTQQGISYNWWLCLETEHCELVSTAEATRPPFGLLVCETFSTTSPMLMITVNFT